MMILELLWFYLARRTAAQSVYHELACLSVGLSVTYLRISYKPHDQTSPNFLCMLPVAVARSSSDGVEIHYVLPVLWMSSCRHTMDGPYGTSCVMVYPCNSVASM